MPGKVFISYSHLNTAAKKELQKHLEVAVTEGQLVLWEDSQIGVGDNWRNEIETALQECCATVFLVTVDFLISPFIKNVEVKTLLERREKQGVRCFPLLWSECDWGAVPWLKAMNIFPRDAIALDTFSEPQRNKQLSEFAKMVREHIQSVDAVPPRPSADDRESAVAAVERMVEAVVKLKRLDNLKSFLLDMLAAVKRIERDPHDYSEADILAFANLEMALRDAAGDDVVTSSSYKVRHPNLTRLHKEVGKHTSRAGDAVPLDDAMLKLVRRGQTEVRARIDEAEPGWDMDPHRALDTFLGFSVVYGSIRFGLLDANNGLVERTDGAAMKGGLRSLRACIGRKPEFAPDLTIFRELDEPWFPEMVVIPTGRFLMGSSDSDPEADGDEKPQHEVEISKRFAIGRYPVTLKEYDAYCVSENRDLSRDRGWGRDRRPVIDVSWNDAQDYVVWLNKQVGVDETRANRLPTEAEWEYCCRAGTTTRIPWGDDWDDNMANGNEAKSKTIEVGSYGPNDWNLSDMIGNVREWCADDWHGDYSTPRVQCAFQSDYSGLRVLRGGSWDDDPRHLRSAFRIGYNPEYRFNNIGFRLSRTL